VKGGEKNKSEAEKPPRAPFENPESEWHGGAFDDFLQDRLALVALLEGRDIARAHHAAVREDWQREALEVIGIQ